MRRWRVIAIAKHGIHLDAEIEAECATDAMDNVMADTRAKVLAKMMSFPDFIRIEIKEQKT